MEKSLSPCSKWKISGTTGTIKVQTTEMSQLVVRRIEASKKASEESRRQNRTLVGKTIE